MILSVPGWDGHPEQREVPNGDLADGFWGSWWGQRALLEGEEPTAELFLYLTAAKTLGGLQATWHGHTGLHELRDLVQRTRPERPGHDSAA